MNLIGLKVKTYWNSHKNLISVQYKGKVVAHVKNIVLGNVTFKVSQKGRLRAIKEGRKNVHAYVVGTVISKPSLSLTLPVTYNPFQYVEFSYKNSGKPIKVAKECEIRNGSVYVENK